MNKRYFYCWYLGLTQVRGFSGQKYALEAIPTLLEQANLLGKSSSVNIPSKVTLRLNEDSLTIIGGSLLSYKRIINSKKPNMNNIANQSKANLISYDQISYVYRLIGELDDIVVIFVINSDNLANINLYKSKLIDKSHTNTELHAFRFDSSDTAKKLEKFLNEFRLHFKSDIIIQRQEPLQGRNGIYNEIRQEYNPPIPYNNNPNLNKPQKYVSNQNQQHASNKQQGYGFQNELKQEVVRKSRAIDNRYRNGEPVLSPRSPPISPPPPPPLPTSFQHDSKLSSRGAQPTVPLVIDDITKEFKRKLSDDKPLLFPPKDYNTIMRLKGDLDKADRRRSLNEQIVGKAAIERRPVDEVHINLDTIRESNNEPNIDEFHFNEQKQNDLSMDEDAESALKFYDDIVNNLTTQPTSLNENFYRYVPPPQNNMQPNNNNRNSLADAAIVKNLTMNPLHVIEEDQENHNEIKNRREPLFRYANNFKRLSNSSFASNQQTPRQMNNNNINRAAIQAGFRSGEYAKLSTYQPKVLSNNSYSSNSNHSRDNSRDNSRLSYYNQDVNNNRLNDFETAYNRNKINKKNNIIENDFKPEYVNNQNENIHRQTKNLRNKPSDIVQYETSNENGFILKPTQYQVIRTGSANNRNNEHHNHNNKNYLKQTGSNQYMFVPPAPAPPSSSQNHYQYHRSHSINSDVYY